VEGQGLDEPHHDGSELYVSDPAPSLDQTVTLFVRVPLDAGVSRVFVRSTPDSEPRFTKAVIDRSNEHEDWWRAKLEIRQPVNNYRFLLDAGEAGLRWLTAGGVVNRDVTDSSDFRLVTFDPPPSWVADSVFYQIFPDRFASSGERRDRPSWARHARWSDPVISGGRAAMRQLYGGDLHGLRARLDHIQNLGATGIYMNPFFPAESNHRYNASSFDEVDPLLGGDEALSMLVGELHARGMRIIGDLTLNHCGATHPWFLLARSDPSSVEASFFYKGRKTDFVYWFDVRSLPKFDHRSSQLRHRLYEGPDSVAAKWLSAPFGLDGWRIDVANMAGRLGEIDLNHALARATRRTMAEANPDSYLLAEHGHDASADLDGSGWHGTMAYAGFTRPAWSWLGDPGSRRDFDFLGVPLPLPSLSGEVVARTIDDFRAAIPWRSWTHNLNLLGSHDTARWRTVAGDADRALAGAGLLLTFPGVPSILYGDEVGLRGAGSESSRLPMPWDEAEWDLTTRGAYQRLIALRRSHVALRRGGFRWAHVSNDVLVYLREHADERLLVQVARAGHEPVTLPSKPLGRDASASHLLGGPDLAPSRGRLTLPADGPAFHVWAL
jgi:alpha-glucosidase